MKLLIAFIVAAIFILPSCQQQTSADTEGNPMVELRYEQNETVSYYEAIEMFEKLASHYPEARLLTYGMTDAGKPLHLFVMSKDRDFDPETVKNDGKSVVLINNGIHPGEPEGIDASIWFADDVLRNHDGMKALLDSTVVCIIPV